MRTVECSKKTIVSVNGVDVILVQKSRKTADAVFVSGVLKLARLGRG